MIYTLILAIFFSNFYPFLFNLEVKKDFNYHFNSPQRIVERKSLGIKTTASNILILDAQTGTLLYKKNYQKKHPLASLTKLMSLLIFLENKPSWEKEVIITEKDLRPGSKIDIYPGDKIKIKDLFVSALVASANNAVMALVHSLGKENDFVKRMNEKAALLGLKETIFVEPTGLNPLNVSTPLEFSKILSLAFKKKEIKEALSLKEYSFEIKRGNRLIKEKIKNTNLLLNSFLRKDYKIIAKTGFLDEAGYNLALEAENKAGKKIYLILFGAESNSFRFQEAKGLVVWVFENYYWPK